MSWRYGLKSWRKMNMTILFVWSLILQSIFNLLFLINLIYSKVLVPTLFSLEHIRLFHGILDELNMMETIPWSEIILF